MAPALAPGPSPVEHVWGQTQSSELPNFAPAGLDTLEAAVFSALAAMRGHQDLLAGFFGAAGLEL